MFNKNSGHKNSTEVVLQYKNIHNSDISSMDTSLSLECLKHNCYDNKIACEHLRPISCPVCAKMIAMNSILVHFYFDHSKVLKLKLTSSKRQHILVKAADLSFETKCIAVVLLEAGKGSTDNVKTNLQTNKIRPFLLLATKMNIGQSSELNIGVTEKKYREEKLNYSQLHRRFYKNDILLFWTCKTDNSELVCNVKLSRKDRKLSFGYTGGAIYIREKQDAENIYQNAECLIIRGEAANNLLDADDQFHVNIRYLR